MPLRDDVVPPETKSPTLIVAYLVALVQQRRPHKQGQNTQKTTNQTSLVSDDPRTSSFTPQRLPVAVSNISTQFLQLIREQLFICRDATTD